MSFVHLARLATRATPATFASRRTLATTVDAVTLPTPPTVEPTPEASTSSTAQVGEAPSTRPAPPTRSQRRDRLPSSTPPPTPYHPHVHVPLLSLFPSTSATAPTAASSSCSPLLVPLPAPLFNAPSRPSLLHKLIIAHLSSLRTGTAATKNRREVAFSGKKIRPQKGTGRARLGSRGSPMLKGGGRAFGKRPKGPDGWTRQVNRKEERLGLSVGLSDKWRIGGLSIVDRIGMAEVSTRKLKEVVGSKGWLDALFVLGQKETDEELGAQAKFELSAGNLGDISIIKDVDELGVWDVVKRRNVVVELDAVDDLIARIDPEWGWDEWEDEEFDEEWSEEELAQAQLEEIALHQELEARSKTQQ